MALSTNKKTLKGRNERYLKREVSKRIQDSRGGDPLPACQKKEKKNIKTSFVMKSVRPQ
jgi:hypothetical protein